MAEKFVDTIIITNDDGQETIRLQPQGGENRGGAIRLHNGDGKETILLGSDFCNLILGHAKGGGEQPGIYLVNQGGDLAVRIEGDRKGGLIGIKNDVGHEIIHLNGRSGQVWLGGGGQDAEIFLKDADNNRAIHLDAKTGDIKLLGGDCAEYFDIAEAAGKVEPGMVMISDPNGRLQPCQDAYDQRVVGVISGAGDLRPGILLGENQVAWRRAPLAVTGKVYCQVEAREAPIKAGDLLTTATTPGRAMKATDRQQAFGAVIGKALQPLDTGEGLLPIIVALQ